MLFTDIEAAANEFKEEELLTKKRLIEKKALPETYEEVLQKLEVEKQQAIANDEEKLRKEEEKIALIQNKIDKKERNYVETKRALGEDDEKEAELQVAKLRVAERKLKELEEGHDPKSSFKEIIGEVFYDAKDFTKDLIENVGDFAHLRLDDDKQQKAHEKAGESDGKLSDTHSTNEKFGEKIDSKTEKKLKAAKKHINDLQKEVTKKMAEVFEQDDEILRKKAEEIEELEQQLKNEERRRVEIEEELAYDQLCEARILEEEKKLKESYQSSDHHLKRESSDTFISL